MSGSAAMAGTELVCTHCQLSKCESCLDDRCQCRRPKHRSIHEPNADVWETTPYGIKWGPIEVTRIMAVDRGPKNGGFTRVIRVSAGVPHHDKDLEIYVTETGRSLRVFRGGQEL